jgi:hypothetical protein
MAKTLSSRIGDEDDDDLSNLEALQDIAFVVLDMAEIDEEPEEVMDDIIAQLDEGVAAWAEKHETLEVAFAAMATDMLQLTLANDGLARELGAAAVVLEGLSQTPWIDELIEKSMSVLRKDGQAQVNMVGGESAVDLKVQLTFDEDQLAEALRTAICEYNNNLAEGILTGKIPVRIRP